MKTGLQQALARTSMLALPWFAAEGCRRGPTFNILGSFFPGWIACITAGILLTAGLRVLLAKRGWEAGIPAIPLLYLSLAVLFGCLFWFVFFE